MKKILITLLLVAQCGLQTSNLLSSSEYDATLAEQDAGWQVRRLTTDDPNADGLITVTSPDGNGFSLQTSQNQIMALVLKRPSKVFAALQTNPQAERIKAPKQEKK